MSQFQSPGFKR